jgi:hypothetical protein
MGPTCTALIADVVGSRRLHPARRAELQASLVGALDRLNASLGDALLARFLVTLGDELQGLLADPRVLPDVLWEIEIAADGVPLRWGIGHGPLTTPLRPEALGMDGPAFHRARDAIVLAEDQKRLGGVFRGFDGQDAVLDGLGRLMHRVRAGMSSTQRSTVSLLRQGLPQNEVAAWRGVSPQAVSQAVAAAGWEAYREGEEAMRAALAAFDTRSQWASQAA